MRQRVFGQLNGAGAGLRAQKLLHGVQPVPPPQPVFPPIFAVRVRVGKLLITIGTMLAGSRTAGAKGIALAGRCQAMNATDNRVETATPLATLHQRSRGRGRRHTTSPGCTPSGVPL